MNNEPLEWYDSRDWYDIPKWYEKEEKVLMNKFLNDESDDCLEEFMTKYASKRFNQYTKNYRIQKQKDMERGIIVN